MFHSEIRELSVVLNWVDVAALTELFGLNSPCCYSNKGGRGKAAEFALAEVPLLLCPGRVVRAD